MKIAMYWEKSKDGIRCRLCPHNCYIKDNYYGICRERANIKNILYSMNYGIITSYGIDPIEKKPLKNFLPGSKIYSIGSRGCNFRCSFCQNYNISLSSNSHYLKMTSDEIITTTQRYGLNAVAFTYNEPTIWFEFMLETAKKAKEKGISTVCVTNGYINEKPLRELIGYIDAFNVDFKSYDADFYREICGGDIEVVKRNIEFICGKAHIEITTLIIEDENDNLEELEKLFKWISLISEDISLHLSRYYPAYKMQNPPTKIETMIEAKKRAKKYLKNVYIGNVPGLD